jgi:type III pantothenate kinase
VLLAIEVGNTNTVFGLFSAGGQLITAFRISTARDRMPDEWYAMLAALLASAGLSATEIDSAIISSVVPSVTPWLLEMCTTRFGVEADVITGLTDVGIRLDVEEPRLLGADRIVDCVAAIARYGVPAIIIDLGTATTFDVVDRNNVYRGGVIAAGVATSLKALATNAAQLFNVELFLPDRVIGRNTADQLRSGLVTGHLAMLEGMIARIDAELGERATVILTGGLATLFEGHSPRFDVVDPDLTLDGLYLIHQRLHGTAGAS